MQTPIASDEERLTRKQAAAVVGCSEATIRRAEGTHIRAAKEPIVTASGEVRGERTLLSGPDVRRFAEQKRGPSLATDTLDATDHGSATSSLGGPLMARLLRLFRDGVEPVDAAIEMEIALSVVMGAWREYHDALGATAPLPRLEAAERAIEWLTREVASAPRDADGRRLDEFLPWIVSELSRLAVTVASLRTDIELLDRSIAG